MCLCQILDAQEQGAGFPGSFRRMRLDHLDGRDTILFFVGQFCGIDLRDNAGEGAFDKVIPFADISGYWKCLVGLFDVNIEGGHVDLLDLLFLCE